MPTYEYVCTSCGADFDAFQSMSDPPLKTCPTCGSAVKRKINGGTGIIFKGSGFYVNDSKKSSSAPRSSDASGGASSSAASPVSSSSSSSNGKS